MYLLPSCLILTIDRPLQNTENRLDGVERVLCNINCQFSIEFVLKNQQR